MNDVLIEDPRQESKKKSLVLESWSDFPIPELEELRVGFYHVVLVQNWLREYFRPQRLRNPEAGGIKRVHPLHAVLSGPWRLVSVGIAHIQAERRLRIRDGTEVRGHHDGLYLEVLDAFLSVA